MNPPWNGCHPTIPTILGCFATYDFQPSTFNQTYWMCHHCCQQMGLMWCHRGRKCVAQTGVFWATSMPLVLPYHVILWCFLPTTFCCPFVHLEGRWHCQSCPFTGHLHLPFWCLFNPTNIMEMSPLWSHPPTHPLLWWCHHPSIDWFTLEAMVCKWKTKINNGNFGPNSHISLAGR